MERATENLSFEAANATAALGVKQCSSSTSAWIAEISGSGLGFQGLVSKMGEGGSEESDRSSAEDIELLGDRGEGGEGGAFISTSRESKAMANVLKWARE